MSHQAWKTYRLGDITKFVSGGTPSKSKPDFWDGSIPWASCKDMKTPFLYDTEDHVSDLGSTNGTHLVQPGTILIVVRGMILAQQFPIAMTMRSMTFNQDLKAVLGSSVIDNKYLFYLLQGKSYDILGLADEAAHGTKRLQSDRLNNLQVQLPPLPTQRRIVAILSAYDSLIENNRRRIAILEEMAHSLYREWFVELRFPGHEGVEIVERDGMRAPEGWEVLRVSNALYINPPTKVPREGLKPFLSMGELSESSMLTGKVEYREGNSGSKFKNGDTLFARITPCLENGKTGFVQFLPSEDAVAFGSTEFIVLRSRTLCPEMVYLLARSEAFRDNAIKSMSGATGRQRVQEKCFDQFYIAQPDATTIVQFAEKVSPMFKAIKILDEKNKNLRDTRNLLLPQLISGELDVSELEIAGGKELAVNV